MRLLRWGLVIAAVVVMSFAGPVSAGSHKPFHVDKDCANLRCVITSSSFKGIPAGSVINYTVNADGSLTAVITGAHGTATGRCVLAPIFGDPSGPGSCVFSRGTGSLTAFNLRVDVTTSNFVTWFWDGSYWMGEGD